jgi:hypothetical protein
MHSYKTTRPYFLFIFHFKKNKLGKIRQGN